MDRFLKVPIDEAPKNKRFFEKRVAFDFSPTEEIFEHLVDAVKDYAIFGLDSEGNVLTWNAGAQRLKGYESYEIIGSNFSRFYTPEDIVRGKPDFGLYEAERLGHFEESGTRVRKDGSQFWADIIITAIRDQDGKLLGFSKVTHDLTERKAAEDELRNTYDSIQQRVEDRTAQLKQAKEEAERAVRARDDFLSIASHELKTPITSMKLQVQLLKRKFDRGDRSMLMPERFKAMLDMDDKQITRITQLINDMLDVAMINSSKLKLKWEQTDLTALIREVINQFSPLLETSGGAITLDSLSPVVGQWDRSRLEQIVINLLTNAMKYGAGKAIHVSVSGSHSKAKLTVIDQGIGIAKSDQKRVFQQFERAVSANEVSGLGLGLYIVRRLVEAHGGTISLRSEVGRGSAFEIELPLKRAKDES